MSTLQEDDVRERVAAQLEALITASGWEIGGVSSDEEAVAVASRAATAFVEQLMLAEPTRTYGHYFRAESLAKISQWATAFRIVNKKNPHQYDQILKRMIGKNHFKNIPPLLQHDGLPVTNDLDKATLLNPRPVRAFLITRTVRGGVRPPLAIGP